MTNMQKKAYKYDQLAELDNRLINLIDRINEAQNRYDEEMKEIPKEEWSTSWQADEYETNLDRIEVLKTLRKELEKL